MHLTTAKMQKFSRYISPAGLLPDTQLSDTQDPLRGGGDPNTVPWECARHRREGSRARSDSGVRRLPFSQAPAPAVPQYLAAGKRGRARCSPAGQWPPDAASRTPDSGGTGAAASLLALAPLQPWLPRGRDTHATERRARPFSLPSKPRRARASGSEQAHSRPSLLRLRKSIAEK